MEQKSYIAVVVVDENWAIGKEGDQFVYLPQDLKHFKVITSGGAVLLGRKTLATFPKGAPLPNRTNYILSADPTYQVPNAVVCHSLDMFVQTAPEDTIFVIGGASVYTAMLPQCHTVYVTKISHSFDADCHFPNLDQDPNWEEALSLRGEPLQDKGFTYHFATYRNKILTQTNPQLSTQA